MRSETSLSLNSSLSTRRRFQTPLKPSKLQNINSVREFSTKKTIGSVKPVKFSKSIVVDESFDRFHSNSTAASIKRDSGHMSKLMSWADMKVTKSIHEQQLKPTKYECISRIADLIDKSTIKYPEADFVVMPRQAFRQLINNEWVGKENQARIPNQATKTNNHSHRF